MDNTLNEKFWPGWGYNTVEKSIKDLKPGDKVLNPDTGKIRTVARLPMQARSRGYWVVETDGEKINTHEANTFPVIVDSKKLKEHGGMLGMRSIGGQTSIWRKSWFDDDFGSSQDSRNYTADDVFNFGNKYSQDALDSAARFDIFADEEWASQQERTLKLNKRKARNNDRQFFAEEDKEKREVLLDQDEDLDEDFYFDTDSIGSDDPDAPYNPDDYLPSQDAEVECPKCLEMTPKDDLVCAYCGYDRSWNEDIFIDQPEEVEEGLDVGGYVSMGGLGGKFKDNKKIGESIELDIDLSILKEYDDYDDSFDYDDDDENDSANRFWAGDIVIVTEYISKGKKGGLSYSDFRAKTLEDGFAGGWDVYNVLNLETGKEESVYGFSILP
jgi:hypothetical protein